jgi:Asp-tRNA(Asn)/Glu-tRNA(Gln) amidotransferase A subunit family amidase
MTQALYRLHAHTAATMIRDGKLKPSTLMQAYVDRVAELEPTVGAFEAINTEAAIQKANALDRQTPKGLLFGLPIGVKDLIDTIDMPTTYGSPIYANHQSVSDAVCIVHTKAEGGLVLGKTVSTEFAWRNAGKTANPHRLKHTPGGSSSGSAAALAAHMVPLAFGSQTSSSIYRPASFCGVVGYKPSFGMINRVGVKPLADSLDTLGTMGHCVADVALLAAAAGRRHDLVLPSEPIATHPRIGLFRTPQWDHASAETQAIVLECAERLSQSGIRVTTVDSPPAFESLLQAQVTIMEAEAAMSLSDEYSAHRDQCSERLVKAIERGYTIEIDRLFVARNVVRNAIAALEEIFREVDVLLSPPAAGEAPEGLEATGDPMFGRIWSALGNPGLTLPYGHGATGLPIGVLLTGARDQDRAFLHMAQTLEAKLRR